MKNNIFLTFILISIAVVFTCCKCGMDISYPLVIENNSTHSLDFYITDGILTEPDVKGLPKSKELLRNIKSDNIFVIDSSIEWSKILKTLPNDTLSIYFFHTDTLKKYSWDVIRERYIVLRRYDLSLKDLEILDFKVPYPPDDRMINMKMHPPYRRK